MPLNLTDFNHFYIVNKICGQEKQRHYLESLGFVPGSRVSILSKLHGYYVVMSELLRLIEVGASCFNHYCMGYDVT